MALKKQKQASSEATLKRIRDMKAKKKEDQTDMNDEYYRKNQAEMYEILYGEESTERRDRQTAKNLEWLHDFQERDAEIQARKERASQKRREKEEETREYEMRMKEMDEEEAKLDAKLEELKSLDQYKVDLSDPLDPKLCQGDNFVPNIMKSFGLSEKLVKNPRVLCLLEKSIDQIASQSNIRGWKGINGTYTREQIDSVVEAIEASDLRYKDKKEEGMVGLAIYKEKGTIDRQVLRFGRIQGERYRLEDEKRATVIRSDIRNKNTRSTIVIYDNNGIEMANMSRHESGSSKNIRLSQYPFATKETLNYDGQEFVSYSILDLNDLSRFYGEDIMRVDSLEDVEKYYEEHKEEIEKAFDKMPEEGKENPALGNALKMGLRTRAEGAGILTRQK